MRIEAEHADHSSPAAVDPVRRPEVAAPPTTGPVDVLTDLRTARERSVGGPSNRERTARTGAAPGGRHRRPPSSGGQHDRRRPNERGRLLVVCGWATGLGAVALASGARGLVLVLSGSAPPWYQPTVAALGLGGIALGGVALHGAARPVVRWTALALANLAVGVSAGLTVSL